MSERLASFRTRLLVGVALLCSIVVTGAIPADAATSNTPVWIGAGFAGFYRSATLPGVHGGNQVAFDYYGPADTTVRIYAAPKNSAYNDQITAHITESGESSGNASLFGWRAVVEIRHKGNPIGRVQFSHLNLDCSRGSLIDRS